MKTVFTLTLLATSFICLADSQDVNPVQIMAAANTPLHAKKQMVTVTNTIKDLVCLFDLPQAQLDKFESGLELSKTHVNGHLIAPGDSQDLEIGSVALISVELPLKAFTEFAKNLNIFKKIGFFAIAWAVKIKFVFIVPITPETTELDLLAELLKHTNQWDTQPPQRNVKFKLPFTFFVTIGGQ